MKNRKLRKSILVVLALLMVIWQASFTVFAVQSVLENEIQHIHTDDEYSSMAMATSTSFDFSGSHHSDHLQDDLTKDYHGIFSWSAYNSLTSLNPNNAMLSYPSGSNMVYIFSYVNAGIQGGLKGFGETLNHIMVVTFGNTNYALTAYPYKFN